MVVHLPALVIADEEALHLSLGGRKEELQWTNVVVGAVVDEDELVGGAAISLIEVKVENRPSWLVLGHQLLEVFKCLISIPDVL